MNRAVLLFMISFCHSGSGWALDELRELEYTEEVQASFSIGEVVWLQVKGQRFLSLYTETEKVDSIGTAIILHPMGGHLNQQKVIKPLRTYLPQHNWATLSIEMPVLAVGAKEQEYYPLFDDANKRIQVAIDYLDAAQVENIILIGYGMGAMMATYFLNENTDAKVKALVAISLAMPKTEKKQAQVNQFIGKITQPFLDIYAEYDPVNVTSSARKRKMAGKSNAFYRQSQISGEGHTFQHDEGLLVKRVYSWINKVFRN